MDENRKCKGTGYARGTALLGKFYGECLMKLTAANEAAWKQGEPLPPEECENIVLLVAENLADTLRNAIRQRERQARKDRGIYTGL